MKTPYFRQFIVALSLASALIWTSSCTTRHIRQAQESWNKAAEIENQLFVGGLSIHGGLTQQAEAATQYRLALAAINEELDKNSKQLKDDHLYGTALMLKVKCLWRLADLDKVISGKCESNDPQIDYAKEFESTRIAIQAALGNGSLGLGDRDKLMLDALPGLRDHDQGLASDDLAVAGRFFKSALDNFDRVIRTESALVSAGNHRSELVTTYLMLSQLSTCRAWQNAIYKASTSRTAAFNHPDMARVREKATGILDILKKRVNEDYTDPDEELLKQVNLFKARLGL